MDFRTIVSLPKPAKKISYHSRILLFGSCFAENISAFLQSHKFITCSNPFGILYNPLSIQHAIQRLLKPIPYDFSDLHLRDNLFHSFDHHSRFSHSDPQQALAAINASLTHAHQFLRASTTLLITFGTAFSYHLASSKRIVANCHKFPAQDFIRKLNSPQEIAHDFANLIQELLSINPDLHIIITISPIRHLRDGAHANQLSKATLQLAVHELQRLFPSLDYFPAYEILLDELRDYRFYAEDMLHPSPQAVKYILQRFSEAYFSPETSKSLQQIASLIAAKNHKLLSPGPQSRNFAQKYLSLACDLQKNFPQLDFRPEQTHFQEILRLSQPSDLHTNSEKL